MDRAIVRMRWYSLPKGLQHTRKPLLRLKKMRAALCRAM